MFRGCWDGVSYVFGAQDCEEGVRIVVAPQIRGFPYFGNKLTAIMLTVIVIIIIVIMIIIIIRRAFAPSGC